MRKSNLFLGLTILAATLILVIYGIAALSPINAPPPATTGDTVSLSPLKTPTVSFGNPSKGPKDAKVVVFVFGDYQCQPCADFDATVNQLLTDYPKDVRIVWKDMPNGVQHPEATNAAVAARCAGDQGGFWPYHDVLMKNQDTIGPTNYVPFAAQLGLDLQTFQNCYDNKVTQPLVQRDYDEGQRLQITSTPTIFVNDRRVEGAISYEQLQGFVESALSQTPTPTPGQP